MNCHADTPETPGAGPDFEYRPHADGTVSIAWRGRVVTRLIGHEATRFLAAIAGDASPAAAQRLMARATGNFKRGNERRPHRP